MLMRMPLTSLGMALDALLYPLLLHPQLLHLLLLHLPPPIMRETILRIPLLTLPPQPLTLLLGDWLGVAFHQLPLSLMIRSLLSWSSPPAHLLSL